MNEWNFWLSQGPCEKRWLKIVPLVRRSAPVLENAAAEEPSRMRELVMKFTVHTGVETTIMENDYRVQESPKVHVRIVNKNVSSTSSKVKPLAKRPPMSRYFSMTESWQRKMNEKPKKLEEKSRSFQNVLFHESLIFQEDIAQGYTTQYKLEERIEKIYPETPSPKSLINTYNTCFTFRQSHAPRYFESV